MYEHKVNGKAKAGEFLTGNLDFITIATSAGNGAGGANNLAEKLDKVVEVISLNGQPIIMGTATNSSLKFANEHTEAWTKAALEEALLAHAGVTATVTVSSDLG